MKFVNGILPLSIAILIMLAGPCFDVEASGEDLTMFAAASTTNAVTEVVTIYEARGFGKIKTSFASASTLAKQIENGAPADIFLSANVKWMDYLDEKGAIHKQTRFDLLGNRLALIVPSQSSVQNIDIKPGADLLSILGKDGRLSIGDPAHVPAGMYGKHALESLGIWNKVSNRIAPMKDVRTALVIVERAETPLGLVYTTDAAISKKVRVAGVFPAEYHEPIVYPIAIVTGGKLKAGKAFLDFLRTEDARAVFIKYGFEVK
ncbi:MAG: molybdate ABC transporter substrate-binding protein [Deltaproteobacteria bacterium]|nr:molybdate ABC transporter substrate-binding protein [Deltaproteobacteria bacterium]